MPYLTPDEIPEDDYCRPLSIPYSTQWLAIVSGALTELTKTWNWQKEGTLTVDECVERMQLMIANYYADACGDCTLPDGEKIIRIGVNFEFEELAGGEWIEPTGDYELPPIEPRTEPTADERMCIAVANAANVFKQLYEDMTDSYNLDLDPAIAFTSWVGKTSTVILVAIGFLSFSVGVVLFGLWSLMYQAMEFLTEDVWDEDMDEKFKCALLVAAEDDAGVVTFDYRRFMDNLAYHTDLGDPSLGQLRLFAQVAYMLQILGKDGLNQAGATTEITEANCDDCTEGWCYKWDFTIDDGGFTADTYGTWVAGEGWQLTPTPSAILIYRDFDLFAATISRFVPVTDNAGGAGVQLAYTNDPTFTPITTTQSLDAGSGAPDLMGGIPSAEIPGVGWNANADTGVVVYLRSLEIGSATGENPMGEDNC